MIKIVAPALRHPENRSLEDFHRYWGESHGPLFSQTKALRRYVQHLTLPEAYGGNPNPTYDGVSMFWFDEPRGIIVDDDSPSDVRALREEVMKDDRQLFDRLPGWPLAHKRAAVTAREVMIMDGETSPGMVKLIVVVARQPGLSHEEFFDHWQHVQGELTMKVPGIRRYVQNHALLETFANAGTTHDGWSEIWFDDLESLHAAAETREWQAMREDAYTLFAEPPGIGIARERIQKEIDVPLAEPEAASMSEQEIHDRLERQGFRALAVDPAAPARIKAAAQAGLLAVWTDEHLVTIDEARIDARPGR